MAENVEIFRTTVLRVETAVTFLKGGICLMIFLVFHVDPNISRLF